jgi:hypothetical protein
MPLSGIDAGSSAFAAVVEAFRADSKTAPIVAEYEAAQGHGGRKFGSNGLKVNGKLFAMLVRGSLVVKLPQARVDALVGERRGTPFEPGHGRRMKEWVTVAPGAADWVALAREACRFVRAAKA